MLPSEDFYLTRDQPYSEKNVCGSGWGVGCGGTLPSRKPDPLLHSTSWVRADALGSSRAFPPFEALWVGNSASPTQHKSLCTLTTPELSRNPGGQQQGHWEKLTCRLPSEAGAACFPTLWGAYPGSSAKPGGR